MKGKDADGYPEEPGFQFRDQLLHNGFEFLHKAVSEVPDDPREATIHLCIALELLLKARLAHEHWSLVQEKPGSKTFSETKKGAVPSVGFTAAIDRVANVTGQDWTGKDREFLVEVSKHRNKVVHFYHPGMAVEQDRLQVAQDLLRATSVLHTLIDRSWRFAIPEAGASLRKLEKSLQSVKPYLQARFEQRVDELRKRREKGASIQRCHKCDFIAADVSEYPHGLRVMHCLVCECWEEYLTLACPRSGCESEVRLPPGARCTCSACGGGFDFATLCEALGLHAEPSAYCSECFHLSDDANVHEALDGSEPICMKCLTCYDSPFGEVWECSECRSRWASYHEEGELDRDGCAACS